ncbi:MAG: hypothetical protein A2017_10910 [Lentisphaerae bacterium GWF2_44_16]|nr:MAG: hypothetical protein A2017_10910 [Lentisphaerae bacterium GWF2_44_16]
MKAEKGNYIPKRVLGVHPHKDDIEGQSSGTLYRWASAGSKIKLITTVLSKKDIEEGGAGKSKACKWEQKAGEALGYEVDFWDAGPLTCQQYADRELTLYICRQIREFKPEIVLCMPPYEQHADHVMCYAATFKAVLMARCPFDFDAGSENLMREEEPGVKEILEETEAHAVKEIWIQPGAPSQNMWRITPNHYEDVSDIWEKKISIFSLATEDLDLRYLTDISEYSALIDGKASGVKYAEAFLRIPIVKKMALAADYDAWRKKTKGKSYMDFNN